MASRDQILGRLRASLARPDLRFPPLDTPPLTAGTRMAITRATGGSPELAARFCTELTKLHGTAEVAASPAEARLALITTLQNWHKEEEAAAKGARLATGQERKVLAWDPGALPVPSVREALADMEFEMVAPPVLHSRESREQVRHIRYGITGAHAAFAATASLLLAHGPHTSRSASLLPFRHVALVPFSRLYPNVEAWLAERREQDLLEFMRRHANIALVSGPSKSADIEMNLTLGVHGPKYLHVILFDDMSEDDSWLGVVTYNPEEDETLPSINPFMRPMGEEPAPPPPSRDPRRPF